MYELTLLSLIRNQIEAIRSDTFEDLVNLKQIDISTSLLNFQIKFLTLSFLFVPTVKHRLTSLNGNAFESLSNLKSIFLSHNYCIDKKFIDAEVRDIASEVISNSCGFDELDSVKILCEKYHDYENFETCFMTERTAINSTNFVIADLRDEEIEGITFEGNTRVEYLPYKIQMGFPNLLIYKANRCSIKQLSKENFEKLNRLKYIELSMNRIQKIFGTTFKGLGSLVRVDLSEF